MPRTKKPAGAAVDQRNGRRIEIVHHGLAKFAAPRGLCPEARKQWSAYWDDPVSKAPTVADRSLLLRWITSLDRYLRMIATADQQPLVLGSTGQDIENPLYKVAERALAAVERCERQLGVGAKNRADLGLAIVAEAKSLADMNAHYSEEPDGDDQDTEDPRLQVVKGEVTAS